jgi:hypothetical protein
MAAPAMVPRFIERRILLRLISEYIHQSHLTRRIPNPVIQMLPVGVTLELDPTLRVQSRLPGLKASFHSLHGLKKKTITTLGG